MAPFNFPLVEANAFGLQRVLKFGRDWVAFAMDTTSIDDGGNASSNDSDDEYFHKFVISFLENMWNIIVIHEYTSTYLNLTHLTNMNTSTPFV